MSQIKRKIERRRSGNKFDEIFFNEIKSEIERLSMIGTKKSHLYKELRKIFVERGWRPFKIMSYYQTYNLLDKNPDMKLEEAFEVGVKIAADISNRKRRK